MGHGANTEEVPLSQEDLEILRHVVTSAIELHKAPSIPKRLIEALKSFVDYLGDMQAYLEKLKGTVGALEGLVVKLGAAYLALKELVDILMQAS